MMTAGQVLFFLDRAVEARVDLLQQFQEMLRNEAALRLFNGFLEGSPWLTVDLYARTLLMTNHGDDPLALQPELAGVQQHLLERLPWVQAVIVKTRNSALDEERRGKLSFGTSPNRKVREHGVWYAVNLTLNQDSSLYLDTRGLRAWALDRLAGKSVLNTFAYTGSLGVAARAGGAKRVVHLDLNRRFLNLAKDSYALNGFPVQRTDFLTGDFWNLTSRLRRAGELFDCVIVDPPFFSQTRGGKVDLVSESQRVINKARPLVAHNGWLVAINNALYLSGTDYISILHDLCSDGYLTIEELIPVPVDFTGYPHTWVGSPPADPAPFNHSTKIAILRARRRDERTGLTSR